MKICIGDAGEENMEKRNKTMEDGLCGYNDGLLKHFNKQKNNP